MVLATAATAAVTARPMPAAPASPGTAAEQFVVAAGFATDSAIQVLRLDTASGQLSNVSASTAGGIAPCFVTWRSRAAGAGSNGPPSHLFVTNHARDKPGTGLTAVRWQAAEGGDSGSSAGPRLAPGGDGSFAVVPDPAHVAASPSGCWLLSASYDGASVSMVPVEQGGEGEGEGGPQLGAPATLGAEAVGQAPHQVLFDPSGRFVYVPCLGSDWVAAYRWDDASGRLTPLPGGAARTALPAGSGPRHLAFHPTLPVAYAINELASTVARLDWDPASGALAVDWAAQPQRLVSSLPPGTPQGVPIRQAKTAPGPVQAASELVLSPDGRFLYASNRGQRGGDNSIAVFEVSPADGALAPLAWETGGGVVDFPRHISLAAGGAFLLVANQHSDNVAVFRRDAATGLLSLTCTHSTAEVVGQPSFVAAVE